MQTVGSGNRTRSGINAYTLCLTSYGSADLEVLLFFPFLSLLLQHYSTTTIAQDTSISKRVGSANNSKTTLSLYKAASILRALPKRQLKK